jgi:hypothetical protein
MGEPIEPVPPRMKTRNAVLPDVNVTPQATGTLHLSSHTALQRQRAQKSSRIKPAERNFFSIHSGWAAPRGIRFSLAADVVAFDGLIRLGRPKPRFAKRSK